jgi:hypothetical protein
MDGSEYQQIYNYISSKKYPEKFNENERRTLRRKCQNYKIKMEELYYIYKDNIDKLVVHRDKLYTVLYMCHDESGCHLGVKKTVSKIASKYYFPNIIVLNIIPGLINMSAFDWSMTRWYKTHVTGW